MPDWFTIECVLGLLLATYFASVGLIALWVATSTRHWFVRAILLTAVLAIPLVVPAYEALLLFSVEALVVVGVWRLRHQRRSSLSLATTDANVVAVTTLRWQFSLSTLLLITVLLSLAAAPAARAIEYFTKITYAASVSMIVDGAAGGAAVLLAAWVIASNRKRIAVSAVFVLLIVLSLIVASVDWLHGFSTSDWYGYWPPVPRNWPPRSPLNPNLARLLYAQTCVFWFLVLAAVAVISGCVIVIFERAWPGNIWLRDCAPPRIAARSHSSRRATRIASIACGLALTAMPLYFLWQVLHPLPVPRLKSPEPNGIDDITAAGEKFSNSSILNLFSGSGAVEPPLDALAKEIELYSAAFDRLRQGIANDIQVVVFPDDGDLDAAQQRSRSQARSAVIVGFALYRQSELERRLAHFDKSARIALEGMQLASLLSRDSDLSTLLDASLIETIVAGQLHAVSSQLSAGECRNAIAMLQTIERNREPIADAERRDRIRDESVMGWQGKFLCVLSDLADASRTTHQRALKRQQQDRAVNGLLTLELALRIYQLENGTLPERLEQLVPEMLPQLPIDPFDPAGQPLKFDRETGPFLLYSVGADGDDDDGRPPAKNPAGWRDQNGDGDLRLDILFKPPAASPTQ